MAQKRESESAESFLDCVCGDSGDEKLQFDDTEKESYMQAMPLNPSSAREALNSVYKMPRVSELLTVAEDSLKKLEALTVNAPGLKEASYISNKRLLLLRYAYSYKDDLVKASAAFRSALEWRAENLECVLHAQKVTNDSSFEEMPASVMPYIKTLTDCLVASKHQPSISGHGIIIVRMGCCNLPTLVKLVPANIIRQYVLLRNEMEFWWCQKQTIKTGYFHKVIRLIDMKGISARKVDRKFLKIFSDISKTADFLHPQLVAKSILMNIPTSLRLILETLRALGLSKRAFEKFWVYKGSGSKPIALQEEMMRIMRPEDMPSFFGGTCNLHNNACICDSPNDKNEPHDISIEDRRAQINKTVSEISTQMTDEEFHDVPE